MNEQEAADMFRALSNSDRLKVIRVLVEAGPEGLAAGEIAEKIGATPSRASFHLAALADSGFIAAERQSRSLCYTVDFTRIGALLTFLMDDCCKASPKLKSCCP